MKIANSLKVFLAAATLLSTMAQPAAAHGDIWRIRTYYTDEALTNPVGTVYYYCDGHTRYYGDVTAPFVGSEIFTCP